MRAATYLKKAIVLVDQWFEEFVCSVLLSILMGVLGVQVFFRYVLYRSFSWNEELARFVFIWVVYLGISLGAKRNEHIRVTIFTKIVPTSHRKYLEYASDLGWLIFCVYIFWLGVEMLQTMFHYKHLSAALQWNTAYIYIIIPLSFLLTAFRIIQYYYRKWSTGER